MSHRSDLSYSSHAEIMTTGYPLSGLRVVAFEQAVAGPLAHDTSPTAGAEIIKIERREGGDFGRHYDTAVNGQSAYFVWLNRGKRSLAVDLKAPGADEITRRLIDSADVVLQNLAPGALDRLGFGYEAVSAKKPGVIFATSPATARTGPSAIRRRSTCCSRARAHSFR